MRFQWLREATSSATAAALLRGDLAPFKENGDDDGDGRVPCPTCKGDGKIRGGAVTCPDCNGTGKVDASKAREAEKDLANVRGAVDRANVACSACGGQGIADGVVCGDCNGTGQGGLSDSDRDVDVPEVGGDADEDISGNSDTRLPEVQGSGGKGKQAPSEVGVGGGPGVQSVPEVGGSAPSVKRVRVPEVTREAQAAMVRMAEAGDSRLRGVLIALTDDQIKGLREDTVAALREKDVDPNVGGGVDRDKIPDEDFAGKNRSFPIVTQGDVSDALQSIGRAGSDNYSSDQLKANIKRIAKRKGFSVPGDGKTKESADIEAIVRRAVADAMAGVREAQPSELAPTFDAGPVTHVTNSHGQQGYEVTLIREGYGNAEDNRWYPGSALKELAESGRAEGMQAYGNHPTLTEEEDRPERDVRELIGTHTDVRYVEEAGVPKVKSTFVPFTTDEHHPHYGWVTTLAEAAVRHHGASPLVGWSLYGLSAGHDGQRPDGSEGQIADVILPSSGDLVTNAGAGGEFARRLLMESARRRRATPTTPKEEYEMHANVYRNRLAEAHKKLREAGSDEERTAAWAEIDKINAEAGDKLEVPTAPGSVEELTEAAPALVTQIRESAKREVGTTVEELQRQLRESHDALGKAEGLLGKVADVQRLSEAVRGAGVSDDVEIRHYIGQAQLRGLSDPEDVKDMIEADRAFDKRREEQLLTRVHESLEAEGLDIEFTTRMPDASDEGHASAVAVLREAGIPVPTKAAA